MTRGPHPYLCSLGTTEATSGLDVLVDVTATVDASVRLRVMAHKVNLMAHAQESESSAWLVLSSLEDGLSSMAGPLLHRAP